MTDAVRVVDGVADVIKLNQQASAQATSPTGEWVDAPSNSVFSGFIYNDETGEFSAPALSLDEQKAAKKATIDAKVAAMMTAGAPIPSDGRHVALDDGSRADMGSMATTALAAQSGAVPWPEGYQNGWITIENTRFPLPTPADGLALAAPVGAYYAGIRQNGRDLKDAVEAADDQAALDAIDIETGWPV